MRFEIKGEFKRKEFKKKGQTEKFTKTIEAESQKRAREKALSLLGSEHRVKRRFVKIDSINELKE